MMRIIWQAGTTQRTSPSALAAHVAQNQIRPDLQYSVGPSISRMALCHDIDFVAFLQQCGQRLPNMLLGVYQ